MVVRNVGKPLNNPMDSFKVGGSREVADSVVEHDLDPTQLGIAVVHLYGGRGMVGMETRKLA